VQSARESAHPPSWTVVLRQIHPECKGLESVLISRRNVVLRLGPLSFAVTLCVVALLMSAALGQAATTPAAPVSKGHRVRATSSSRRRTCLAARRHKHVVNSTKCASKNAAKSGLRISVLRHRIGRRLPAPTPPGSTGETKPTPPVGSKGPTELPKAVEPVPPVEVPLVEEPPAKKPIEEPPVEKKPIEEPPVEKKPIEKEPVEEPAKEPPLEEAAEVAPFRFFAPTSFWNEKVPADAPVDSHSAAIVSALSGLELSEQAEKRGPEINTTAWSVPIYSVPASEATVRVALVNKVSPALQSAWNAVPLPSNAQPAAGTDEHLVVWQPSTNKMWEFWGLEKPNGTWQASWGGAMENVTTDKGVYGPEAWSGASTSWGASASSLPIAGGLVTLEDLERGVINHALAIAVPNVRENEYASPAQRTDGATLGLSTLPEGAHLRLEPGLDLAALHLPPLTLMLAEAAQRYGIFVRDRASNIALYAQDPIPTGIEPFTGTAGYFEGKSPPQLLVSFPWSHLQVLKMELHPAG
jgi:outer membrane biosynthesis protein TonB